MDNNIFKNFQKVEPQMSTEAKLERLGIAFLNLQKVCSSLMELYTATYIALTQQMAKQFNFDIGAYKESLEQLLDNVRLKKDGLENEIYGLEHVKSDIQNGDMVRVIIERKLGETQISNRELNGSYYIMGKNQLLPFIEAGLMAKNVGDKFTIDNLEDEVKVIYDIEVLDIKRKIKAV